MFFNTYKSACKQVLFWRDTMEVELKDAGRRVKVQKPSGILQMEYIAQMLKLQGSSEAQAILEWLKYRHTFLLKVCPEFKTLSEVQELTTGDIESVMSVVETEIFTLMGENFLRSWKRSASSAETPSKS